MSKNNEKTVKNIKIIKNVEKLEKNSLKYQNIIKNIE